MNAEPVDWRRGAAAGLLVAVLSQTAYVPAFVAAAPVPKDRWHGVPYYVVVCVVLGLATALSIYAGLKALFVRRPLRPWRFGLRVPKRIWTSLALFVAIAVPAWFVGAVITYLLGLSDEASTARDLTHDQAGFKLFFSFAAVAIAPWVEEIAFRGLLYSSLAARFGFWPAAVVSSLCWSGLHLAPAVLVIFTLEGMALCRLRRRTGSILPGVVIHGCWNAFVTAISGAGLYAAPAVLLFGLSVAAAVMWQRRDPELAFA
jgi:membrane protease YdiL (CAAX protease family)